MQCLVGCIAISAPRVAIILVVILSDYLGRAYDTLLWPIVGFMFLPTTTLAYAWAIHRSGSVEGVGLVLVVIAVLLDLGLLGGSAHSSRERG